MQQHSLLATKLYIPPVRPELVSRPRLIEQLNVGLRTRAGFCRALTLISAPAGFGKTTLASEWVNRLRSDPAGKGQSGLGVAWLSLDEGDGDPVRFLAYLVAALQTVNDKLGQGILSALQSPQPPPAEEVLISLINEIAAISNHVILILDDHHSIESPAADDALAFLLERLPPQLHLVIASREDPHLPLARLRARGQLSEIRASDLRFTYTEAAEFLNEVMGLGLSAEDIAALEARTEGWIAGLQLAALSMKGRQDSASLVQAFRGSHRYVLDYLLEEVLEQQTEPVQTFLLQTSILNTMCGSLCDAVRFGNAESPSTPGGDAVRFGNAESPSTPGGDAVRFGNAETPGSSSEPEMRSVDPEAHTGRAILEKLERANLFLVPLDEERQWYRYHHLFADLLRQRLRRMRPEWIRPLHGRASAWFEQNGYADEAIEHGLRAEDLARVARLIEDHVDAIWQRGEHAKLRRWLAELPVELVFSKPHLCILHAWDQFTSGQQDAAEESLQAAERALESGAESTSGMPPQEREPLSESDRRMIQGRAAAIRAFLAFYRGDEERTREYASQALDRLPEQDLTWRSTATVALGDAYAFAGDLAGAQRVREEAVEAGQAAGNIYMVLIASMKLAVTMRQLGRLERVIEICRQKLDLAVESGLSQTVVVGWLLAIWGEVLAEQNDLEGAVEKAKRGVELAENGRDLAALGWSYLCLLRILFSAGDMAAAQEAIQKMEKIAARFYMPPWIMNQVLAWQVRIWLAQDQQDVAARWADAHGLDTAVDPSYLRELDYTVLARTFIAQGKLDEAATLLQDLLESAELRGHVSRVIELLSLQALVSEAVGDRDQAMAALRRALTLAEAGGFARVFVDEGPSMAHLLYEALSRGIAPDSVRRLLAAFPVAVSEQATAGIAKTAQVELVEPLSSRELEVLQLIEKGLTNPEIASRLFLSLNTVKAHTRNIYGKLSVHSRTQAIARSRSLGILPPR